MNENELRHYQVITYQYSHTKSLEPISTHKEISST